MSRFLLCYRARYYDPATSEFISRDPLEYVDGMSLYRGYFALGGMDPNGLARRFGTDPEGVPIYQVTNEHDAFVGVFSWTGGYYISIGGCYQIYNGRVWPVSCGHDRMNVNSINDEVKDEGKFHHTRDAISVNFCNCDPHEAKRIVDTALASFSEFNRENTIAQALIEGNIARFDLQGADGFMSDLINSNKMNVTLSGSGSGFAQEGTTNSFHPLVGVRRWGSNLSTSGEEHVLSVWTEAYEIPNGLNVLAAKRGRDKASEMWNAYLKRVAELGKEKCGGTISQGQTIDEFTDKSTNPFAK